MTPQELKNSILQLAIEGRLVEQRAEEGTAEELIETIKLEDSLEGRRVKKKNISEYGEEDFPFEIPATWKWEKLGNICLIARGGSPRPIKAYLTNDKNGINWIKIGDTEKNSKYICHTAEKITIEGSKKSRFVHAGDFLLTNSMSFGRPYILKIDGCIHDGWLVISQKKKILSENFLYYLLSSSFAYNQFASKVSGAVVKNLNSDKVANSFIPIPPLAEQHRIVAKIEELLPYIDRYEKAWSRLEEFNKRFPSDMQKSLLQYVIEGRLVEQREEEGTAEELYAQIQAEKAKLISEGKLKKQKALPEITEKEKPFEIPASWKWVRLGEVTTYANTKDKVNPSDISPETWSLDLEDIEKESGRILKRCLAKERKIKGDKVKFYAQQILYSKLRPYLKKILVAEDEGVCSSEIVPFYAYGNIVPKFIVAYLKSPYIDVAINSVTYGVKMPRVGTDTMINLLIPLPPLAEQHRIVARLEELLPLCERLKK